MLRDLHAELAHYPAHLPVLAPLQDIPSYLARPQTTLTPAEAAALAAAHTRLTTELGSFPARPLHGDAGAGNLMATDSGWVWHDFEDTCSGPVAWDVAASTASQRLDARRVLAAYGEPVDPAQLKACEQLRRLHLTVWYNLYAERLPHLRPRAAELLTLWPPPDPSRDPRDPPKLSRDPGPLGLRGHERNLGPAQGDEDHPAHHL
jgi:Ser/Thr protein kinase RdoA (MazF antagonist)